MGRLVVALDAGLGVSPEELAAAWDADEQARELGGAALEEPPSSEYIADVVALVVIPLAVNLASSATYDLVRKLVAKARPAKPEPPDLEIIHVDRANGDRILVVRQRRPGP